MKKFANFEFIFAIRDSKLGEESQEYILNIIQNRKQDFIFILEKLRLHPSGSALWDKFIALASYINIYYKVALLMTDKILVQPNVGQKIHKQYILQDTYTTHEVLNLH